MIDDVFYRWQKASYIYRVTSPSYPRMGMKRERALGLIFGNIISCISVSYHFKHVPVCVPMLFAFNVLFLLSFSRATFRNLFNSVSKALRRMRKSETSCYEKLFKNYNCSTYSEDTIELKLQKTHEGCDIVFVTFLVT